ncbi:MAG: hypothetical protein EPO02_04315 [Nitrospirae bacterium]|nr:MAG: hypothetical protein EPO02_04315 [Nitrospirota bacterium]
MATFKSGAFAQQCFAAHPLSLSFKSLTPPDRVVVECVNCHMRHRFTARALTTRAAEVGGPEREAAVDLGACAAAHPAELRVSAVNVMDDAVKLRCGECRRTYAIAVSVFETYRRDG